MSDELIRAIIAGNPALKACGQRYPDIEKLGNADGAPIDNPTPQGTIPRPLSLTDVFGVIAQLTDGAAEMAKLQKLPDWAYNGGVAAMQERNETSITNWLQTIAAIVGFAPATVAAMSNAKTPLLAATIPDPNYIATIPGPSIFAAAGLPRLTAADIQGVDNRLGLGGNW